MYTTVNNQMQFMHIKNIWGEYILSLALNQQQEMKNILAIYLLFNFTGNFLINHSKR